MNQETWYYIIGFIAQGMFSIRMLIQWVMSEKAHKVVSPAIYWQISLLGAFLLSVYGWLRGDMAIILGQLLTYYIYIWNLNYKQRWVKINKVIRVLILVMPLVALAYVLLLGQPDLNSVINNVPRRLMMVGIAGQTIFTLRFVYQWWFSYRHGESILPKGFWLLSILGASITFVYGIYRSDPVLIVGQGCGLIAYARNLWLACN